MDQSVNVLEGHTLTIPCEATGRPNPVISWTAPHSKKLDADSDDLQTVKTNIAIRTCSRRTDDKLQCSK